jgi:hypothetical protein
MWLKLGVEDVKADGGYTGWEVIRNLYPFDEEKRIAGRGARLAAGNW